MTRTSSVTYEFVEFIPTELVDGRVYISIPYSTVVHKCLCGCGNEVVTPLGPTDWRLTFDGESISLHPSIGNWSLRCKSHYWILNSGVQWAESWSGARIEAARERDRRAKAAYFSGGRTDKADVLAPVREKRPRLLHRLISLLGRGPRNAR
jgi:hypothetical protein